MDQRRRCQVPTAGTWAMSRPRHPPRQMPASASQRLATYNSPWLSPRVSPAQHQRIIASRDSGAESGGVKAKARVLCSGRREQSSGAASRVAHPMGRIRRLLFLTATRDLTYRTRPVSRLTQQFVLMHAAIRTPSDAICVTHGESGRRCAGHQPMHRASILTGLHGSLAPLRARPSHATAEPVESTLASGLAPDSPLSFARLLKS